MTPILTGCCAWAPAIQPTASTATPAAIVRRVILSIRRIPLKPTCSFPNAKDWHGLHQSANSSANPITLEGLVIELDAEPGPLGQEHMAGLELERCLEQLGA